MTNIMEKQFYRQRKDFDLSCIERDKKLTMPEGVEYTENIAYTKDAILRTSMIYIVQRTEKEKFFL